jgi:hypothetical protein
MQRVVRSSLVGLLTLAALAACGDSGTDSTPTGTGVTPVVHSVTVSPSSLTINVGGTGILAASVDADGSLDRTVTWSSSNTAVATVDAASGKVTGVSVGTVTVTATSKANTSVQGAAAVTVIGSGSTSGAVPTVTISAINQGGNPVNIGNVAGQIDVVLNVDTNGGVLKTVTATLKCGTDSVVNSQTVSNLAPIAAEAASSPVTLSFNTAAFSSAGVAALHNGACTISAQATTAAGTQSATNSTTLTLNNADVIVGSLTFGATKTDAAGLAWVGKSVAVAVTPVFYTPNRTAATTTITLNAGGAHTQTVSGAGTHTVTFTDNNDGKSDSLNIDQITNAAATVTVTTIDSNGQPFANAGNAIVLSTSNPLAPTNVPSFRLDTQKPAAGTFVIANNAGQNTSGNGYINGSFRFASDSAAGYCGPNSTNYTPGNAPGGVSNGNPVCTGNTTANTDNGGVDNVTVVFQTYLASAKKTSGVTATNPSALAESQTASTYKLDMITTDALGNADTTDVGTFGVDLTAPSSFAATQTGGPANQTIYTTTGTNGPDQGGQMYTTSGITDNLSGPGPMLVAQTRNSTLTDKFKASVSEGRTYTNTGATGTYSVGQAVTDLSPCVIGRFNAASTDAGANALTVYSQSGSTIGYCTPVAFAGNTVPPDAAAVSGGTNASEGYFTTEIIGIDQAGNRAAPFVATIVADATGPTVSGIDLPGSITAGSSVTIPATANDSVDVVGSYATVHYTGAGDNLRYAKTPASGVAFDNTLTRSASIAPVISSFIRNLAPATAGAPASTTTTGNNAQSIDVGAVDEAYNTGALNAGLGVVSLGTESSNAWSSAFAGGFVVAADSANITNCPAATGSQTTGCGAAGKTAAAHPTSVNLTASASGTTGTFANPFSTVTFWRQLPGGDWVQIGSSSSATVTDTGAGNGRTWSYTLSYDPPTKDEYGNVLAPQFGSGPIAVNIIAVGANASGDAVATAPVTIQLTNP